MEIELLQKDNEREWDEFVSGIDGSLFYYTLAWRNAIKDSYGHQYLYLLAREKGKVRGILPVFLIENIFFGKKIVSLPFCSYGGILAKDKQAQDALFNYLVSYIKKGKYNLFELRASSLISGSEVDLSEFTFILDLKPGKDKLWSALDKKNRNQIRKSNKFDLRITVGNQYLKDFYTLYQKTMKKLGTPAHSIIFMENIIKLFPFQAKIIMLILGDTFIAGLFLIASQNTAYNLWAASDSRYLQTNLNNFLYWETIKYCVDSGLKFFDFGRSSNDSGTFHFKKQWGAKLIQLYYHYFFREKRSFSIKKKYGKFSKIWSNLPIFITNLFGPKLRKYIP
ncbi:MAG: peptidoglycan bridge formation glycyltransferase FemA/FemB family protein [Nanoarchaeota archaeon]|nr:peptidoglycan bridge formation glycyltransferase FemA/FemB family protein [Nanoarchaeota archaeon]